MGLAARLPRLSDAALRILHLARHRRVSLADGNKNAARSESSRRNFLQLSDPDRHCALPDRIHPHQSALLFRIVQRASREFALDHSWRGVTLAYQEPISYAQERASHRRAHR